jgi:hypothetical protein
MKVAGFGCDVGFISDWSYSLVLFRFGGFGIVILRYRLLRL